MRPVRVVLVGVVAVAALGGCGGETPDRPARTTASPAPTAQPSTAPATMTPTPTPTSSPKPAPSSEVPSEMPGVSVTRSGGFVGATEILTVGPRGGWVYTSQRGTKRTVKSGRLGAADLTRLRALATDPALFDDPPARGDGCADGFRYLLKVGSSTRMWSGCGGESPRTAGELVALLAKATPF